jgi:serine/threonine protein kinase
LRQMMAYEPDKRISAVKALQHSFFNPPASLQSEKAASPAEAAPPPAAVAAAAAAT